MVEFVHGPRSRCGDAEPPARLFTRAVREADWCLGVGSWIGTRAGYSLVLTALEWDGVSWDSIKVPRQNISVWMYMQA